MLCNVSTRLLAFSEHHLPTGVSWLRFPHPYWTSQVPPDQISLPAPLDYAISPLYLEAFATHIITDIIAPNLDLLKIFLLCLLSALNIDTYFNLLR